jgi:type IV pilus assembly protein PilA
MVGSARHNHPGSRRSPEGGFTLIELLVVVVTIGILAAIAIPVFMNQKAKAYDAAVKTQVANVPKSIETILAGNPSGPIRRSSNGLAVQSGASLEGVTTSNGVHWNTYGSASGYCVTAWHDNSKTFTEVSPLSYDSVQGGLLKAGESCAAVPASPDGTAISGGGMSVAAHYAWTGAANLSTSTATPTSGVTRTNLTVNPSSETNVDGFFPSGDSTDGNAALSRELVGGVTGPAFARTTWTVANTTGLPYVATSSSQAYCASVTPGLTYTASLWVRPSKNIDVRLYLNTHNGFVAGSVQNGGPGPLVHLVANRWKRITSTITPEPGFLWARPIVQLTGGTTMSVGDTIDIDGVQVEQADAMGTYFDGSTTSTD